jgi:stearoyl-CoA desaturase (delta-9 desaturase)
MMRPVERVIFDSPSPLAGKIKYDYPKLGWNFLCISVALILGPLTFTANAFLIFVFLSYTTLLIGHSVGMHRMMIHRTFKANKLVRRTLIYIGVLVGLSGPFGIVRIHDLRDWAQRKENCHDFFSHKRSYLKDLWWQLSCKFVFEKPPVIEIESQLKDDNFLVFCEKTWRWHQIPLAIILYALGGWSFVVWGIFVRISVSVIGHWTITYFCHNPGKQKWKVKGAAVQASNLSGLGLITYGECWHNNHHAFPESAKIGLEKGQWDPAWWCIVFLQKLNLIYDVKLPRARHKWDDLIDTSANN